MNKLSKIIKTYDVFQYDFKFEMIDKQQKGSTVGGLFTIVTYVLYLIFCFLIAENFWTQNDDSYSTNYFKYKFKDEGPVMYSDLNMSIGLALKSLDPGYQAVLQNETERSQYIRMQVKQQRNNSVRFTSDLISC